MARSLSPSADAVWEAGSVESGDGDRLCVSRLPASVQLWSRSGCISVKTAESGRVSSVAFVVLSLVVMRSSIS